MTELSRRSALSLAITTTFVSATRLTAQAQQVPEGISRQAWGKCDSAIPGYKWIAMRDVVYGPGAKTSDPKVTYDMVCHVPDGELLVTRTDGVEFIARKGDIWARNRGISEELENIGSTTAIVRIIDLIPA